jgi:quinol-cytochrome oxidoreductase complex cytochrome b subunit
VETELELDRRRGLGPTEVVLRAALALELCSLMVTGLVLFLIYRPARPGVVELPEIVRLIHRVASWIVLPTSVAYLATGLAAKRRRTRRTLQAASLFIGCLGASFTGFLLPWNQVALWAVSVGPELRGFRSVYHDATRFYLLDSVEVGVDTMQRWLTVHVVLGAVMAGIAVALVIGVVRSADGPPEVERERIGAS